MKKLALAMFITAVANMTVLAQEKGTFEFGGNFGLNRSNVSDGSGQSTDPRTAFNIAASGEYYFSDRWGIKTKLIYDSKGWDNAFIHNFETSITTITDFKLNYITIPVMANWHFGSVPS